MNILKSKYTNTSNKTNKLIKTISHFLLAIFLISCSDQAIIKKDTKADTLVSIDSDCIWYETNNIYNLNECKNYWFKDIDISIMHMEYNIDRFGDKLTEIKDIYNSPLINVDDEKLNNITKNINILMSKYTDQKNEYKKFKSLILLSKTNKLINYLVYNMRENEKSRLTKDIMNIYINSFNEIEILNNKLAKSREASLNKQANVLYNYLLKELYWNKLDEKIISILANK